MFHFWLKQDFIKLSFGEGKMLVKNVWKLDVYQSKDMFLLYAKNKNFYLTQDPCNFYLTRMKTEIKGKLDNKSMV